MDVLLKVQCADQQAGKSILLVLPAGATFSVVAVNLLRIALLQGQSGPCYISFAELPYVFTSTASQSWMVFESPDFTSTGILDIADAEPFLVCTG